MPQRRKRKRHGTSTAPPDLVADAPDRVWAVDFQFDVTTNGRPVKIASIIDEHTRECLGGMVERSITGDHLIDELDRVAAHRGAHPGVPRCDNGPELACSAMVEWAARPRWVALHSPVNSFWARWPKPASSSATGTRLQPLPSPLIAGLPTPSPLCCRLYPPMNDSGSPVDRGAVDLLLGEPVEQDGHADDDQCCCGCCGLVALYPVAEAFEFGVDS